MVLNENSKPTKREHIFINSYLIKNIYLVNILTVYLIKFSNSIYEHCKTYWNKETTYSLSSPWEATHSLSCPIVATHSMS